MSASSDRERMPQRQLGDLMTELGLISEEQLATVLEVQQKSKRPLGQIIVELGFASGAAVAHALAMQSGGALKTEYGFALGVSAEHGEPEEAATPGGLPKLRLAPKAAVPPVRANPTAGEEPETDFDAPAEAAEEPTPLAALPAVTDEAEPVAEPVDEVEEIEEIEEVAEVAEVAEVTEVEVVEEEVEDAALEIVPMPDVEESPAVEADEVQDEPEATGDPAPAAGPDPEELEQLRAELERLEAELAEHRAAAAAEQERLAAEVARLESALTETTEHEHELARLREEHERATAELERLHTAHGEAESDREHELAGLRGAHERATTELEGLQTMLAEAQTAAAEHERRLAEEQERHAEEQERHAVLQRELAAQHEQLQAELGDALERLAVTGAATEERDRLRAELEQFETTFAEAQTTAAAEHERLLGDVDRLESALAAAQATHQQELSRLRDEHEHARTELDHLHTTLHEAQTAAAEHERRLAEERDRHAGEQSELAGQRDRLQEELGNTLEQLAALAPAVQERDGLRVDVEQLRVANAESQDAYAAELRGMAEERDGFAAELAEAQQMLVQAERVRESVIALTAERDSAVAELEQLRTVAADAQTEAEELNGLLADEQDRHQGERQTLLAQRTVLEHELGSAIEQLAAAGVAADERERQIQLATERIQEVTAELTAPAPEAEAEHDHEVVADQPDTDAAPELEPLETDAETGPVDYSLFVPGPNGYELVSETGRPPHAGQTVEILLPDRDEPATFEVVRSGRTLPGGEISVYLAQV